MRNQRILLLSALLAAAGVLAYFFLDLGNANAYIVTRRLTILLAVLATGYAVACSSVLFQTLTHNRILTPSVVGFDSLYLLIQAVTVFLFGGGTLSAGNVWLFCLDVCLMVVFSELLYRLLFRREGAYLYFILLAGVICGMFFRSIFSFLLVLIDPNEFDILQEKMFASFSLVQGNLIALSLILLAGATFFVWRMRDTLDVFLLGRENAHNLGVDCTWFERRIMRIVAVMVAVSTALVGPITFLGLMVVNICYALLDTRRHGVVIVTAVMISWAALFFGLILVERVLTFATNLTVILNGIGGIYFIYLLTRRGKAC